MMGGNCCKISLIALLCLIMAISCAKRIYVPVQTTTTITERLVDTVVKVNLKVYRDTVTTPDTISHLINPYGDSWARVSGGMLHHSLNVNETPIEVRTVVKYINRIDSIPVPVEVIKPIYTEKELTTWQKTRMRAGEIAFASIGLLIVFWIAKNGYKKGG